MDRNASLPSLLRVSFFGSSKISKVFRISRAVRTGTGNRRNTVAHRLNLHTLWERNVMTGEIHSTQPQYPSRPPALARRASLLLGVLAIVLVVILAYVLRKPETDPLTHFRSAHRSEARLTGFDYVEMREAFSGESSDLRARYALADLKRIADQERSSENLHRLALGELAFGNSADAYSKLVELNEHQPADATVLSDLSAAEIVLGRLADAAEHGARALEIDPGQKAAAFNWALALEKLSNRPAAIEAWESYVALDPGSGWTAEARQHLAMLRRPRSNWRQDRLLLTAGARAATIRRLVEKYPQHARTRIQNILLPAWGESGNPAELELMRAMAAVRAPRDPFLEDVITNAATRRAQLQPGFRAFRAACDAEEVGKTAAAGEHFAAAARVFEREGSPLHYAAAIYSASSAFFAGGNGLERVQQIEDRLHAEGNRYPCVKAEAAWVRGLIQSRGGYPSEALDAYDIARKAAHQSGEIENEVALGELIASQFDAIGDPAESEAYRAAALRRSDEIDEDPERLYVAFAETAFYALRGGHPRLALAFIASQKRMAEQLKDPQRLAWSNGQQALGLLQLNRLPEAQAAAAQARQQALVIQDEGRRDWTLADIDYIAGRIAVTRSHPDQAITAFSSALRIWDRYGWRSHAADAHAVRAEVYLGTGDRKAAEDDFRAGIGEMEQQRVGLEPPVRVAYFERSDRLFEGLIGLLVDEGRVEEALSIAERKRARVLLDQLAADGVSVAPLDAAALTSALASRASLLEVTLLDRGAELWLVSNGRVVHARSSASRSDIEAAVKRHLSAIAADDSMAVKREGMWLYRQLVAPVAAGLEPGSALVIVPDGILQELPFAALVGEDGAYLIERYPLAVTPSASVFVKTPTTSSTRSLLTVAQPAPAGFDPLPNVVDETRAIAKVERRGLFRVGGEVTPSEFLELSSRASVVHFAGHALTDIARPSRSALAFESPTGDASLLTAREIGRSRFASHPLVVLAACSTGRGRLLRNEGTDSLAAAFLQAGARGVVATLWDVDDATAGLLFRPFHQHLGAGARPADALREAQIALIHSSNARDRSPSIWASTVVSGTI